MDDLQSALRHPRLTPDAAIRRECQELALTTIRSYTQKRDPKHAVAEWARKLLAKSNQSSPPCNITRVAETLSAKISYVPLSGSARLLYQFGENQILVNRSRRSDEQRFSIAHECGHIVLRNIIVKQIEDAEVRRSVFQWGNSDEQEQLCNQLAAELLMPQEWVRAALAKSDLRGAELAHALAAEFRVSFTMAIRRLVELGLPYLVVFWYPSDEDAGRNDKSAKEVLRLRFGWSCKPAGYTSAYIPKVQAIPRETLLYRVFAEQKRNSAWEEMKYAGLHGRTHFADAIRTRSGVLLLVDLERPRELAASLHDSEANCRDGNT